MTTLPPAVFVGASDGKAFVPDERGRWQGWLAKYRGRRVTMTAEPERLRRTAKQNARYWALIVPIYQEWVGEPDKLQAHEDLLSLHNRADRLLPTGEVVQVVKRSRNLSIEEFLAFTQRVEMWMAQQGIEFPELEDA